MTVKQQLIDMGFLENRIEKALLATSSRGMEPAMEWLLSHADDPDIDDPIPEVVESSDSTLTLPAEPKVPLTEEEKLEQKRKMEEQIKEKEEQKRKIEEKIKQRRQEREEREKQEALEREKRRMLEGKDMSEARRKHDELEAKKIVDERKRQKADDKAAKAKVLAQIEADKARRRGEKPVEVRDVPKPAVTSPVKPPARDYNETRLQMRLPDGSALVETFKAKEPLSAVRLYIETNRTDGLSGNFTMQTTFPRRVFTEEDMEAPLSILDLVPSAVIMVSKPC